MRTKETGEVAQNVLIHHVAVAFTFCIIDCDALYYLFFRCDLHICCQRSRGRTTNGGEVSLRREETTVVAHANIQ